MALMYGLIAAYAILLLFINTDKIGKRLDKSDKPKAGNYFKKS